MRHHDIRYNKCIEKRKERVITKIEKRAGRSSVAERMFPRLSPANPKSLEGRHLYTTEQAVSARYLEDAIRLRLQHGTNP
jgi:hypothetical protein